MALAPETGAGGVMKPKERQVFRGLALVAILLGASALLRFPGILGPVLAQTGAVQAGAQKASPMCAGLSDLERLHQTLAAEKAALAQRTEEAETRARSLAEAEDLVRESYAELRLMQAELEAEAAEMAQLRSSSQRATNEELARLVTIYEAMKPKEAAGLFETMEPRFAAGFLRQMSPQSAAAILSGLSPDVAYAISVLIAGRQPGASGAAGPQGGADG